VQLSQRGNIAWLVVHRLAVKQAIYSILGKATQFNEYPQIMNQTWFNAVLLNPSLYLDISMSTVFVTKNIHLLKGTQD
jgi:hypothetical protein